jgi:hypothetical protein
VGIAVRSPAVRSLDFPLILIVGITRRERETDHLHKIDNTTKVEQLILSKTYVTKLVINNRLLRM